MANSDTTRSTSGAGNVVAGYFRNGEDAHRAILELRDQGFQVNEIGAAFHARSLAAEVPPSIGNFDVRSATNSDTTIAGAGSGTSGVTPMGLSTGAGTPFAGAPTSPGPIPGSKIPSSLPREIPSELPSDLAPNAASAGQSVPSAQQGWRGRLSSVFDREGARPNKSASKFGTGEGDLQLNASSAYVYSGSAFQGSFRGMGIPENHSQRLARELERGGAIVTVNAGSERASLAAQILERNEGVVRYESFSGTEEEEPWAPADDAQVEVFGEFDRVYPRYIPGETRKAS